MANDDRNPTPKSNPPARAPGPMDALRGPMDPIRVRELRTLSEEARLPPPAKSSILRAGQRGNTSDVIQIQYEPWQRHHRVREVDEHGKVKIEVCIPESWVAYTPEDPA